MPLVHEVGVVRMKEERAIASHAPALYRACRPTWCNGL